jgi:cysteinyl-tRNA synthetase
MGHSPRAIRYLLISAHYRKQLNFTFEGLKQAETALSRIDNLTIRLSEIKRDDKSSQDVKRIIEDFSNRFIETMDDDLNISGGIGHFFDFLREINNLIDNDSLTTGDRDLIMDTLRSIDTVFGFIFFPETAEGEIDAERIEKLIQERAEARSRRDFKRADEIRHLLQEEGILLEDTKDGTRWKRGK